MKRYAIVAAIAVTSILVVAAFAISGAPFEAAAIAVVVANVPPVPAAFSSEDVVKLSKELGAVTEQVKQYAEDIRKKMEAGQAVSDELKEKADKALLEQGALREKIEGFDGRIREIEQTVAQRNATADHAAPKTPGQLFVESEVFKKAQAEGGSWRGRARVPMAAITTSGSGFSVEAQRIPGIVQIAERRMTVRDLLTPGRTSSNAIQYIRETGFTNNAQVQAAEGDTKGESDIDYELVTRSVATIAHFIVASKQILDDAPMLQSSIDGRLRFGLAYKEEDQLLNGSGTGGNVHGIIPQAADYAPAFQPSSVQRIDTLRLALLQSELAEFPATGLVLHPTDWAKVELVKDGENRYLFAQPQNTTDPRIWGRPVVPTQAMDLGEFLAGAFRLGAQIFDREDANVEISTEDNDNFRKNLVTIRAEERLVLAVYRPEAFVHGEFGDAS